MYGRRERLPTTHIRTGQRQYEQISKVHTKCQIIGFRGGLQAHTRPKGTQIAHQKKTKRIEMHQNGAKN
ncbi:MAG TPA: hypothetical protein DHW73_05365 [Pseudomonas sp.]|nr:hypothetical protein [Pseudomonadales bacterium]HCL40788.1 hypothetical protein [Pseudomonas sp.]